MHACCCCCIKMLRIKTMLPHWRLRLSVRMLLFDFRPMDMRPSISRFVGIHSLTRSAGLFVHLSAPRTDVRPDGQKWTRDNQAATNKQAVARHSFCPRVIDEATIDVYLWMVKIIQFNFPIRSIHVHSIFVHDWRSTIDIVTNSINCLNFVCALFWLNSVC